MYRCHDLEFPRLFIVDVKDIINGRLDQEVAPGFECVLEPCFHLALHGPTYSDTVSNIVMLLSALSQQGCSKVIFPDNLWLQEVQSSDAIPSNLECILHPDTVQYLANKTIGEMQKDYIFACDILDYEYCYKSELFERVYIENHWHDKNDMMIIAESAITLDTPLGSVSVMGPEGPVPFRITKLLNRSLPCGELQAIYHVNNLYKLSISLDDMTVDTEYHVGCKGRRFSFCNSDECTECFTCFSEGITLGIGVFDPNDDFGCLTPYSPLPFKGYTVCTYHGQKVDSPIEITPISHGRDQIKEAILYVGWLTEEESPNENEESISADSILGFFLT